MTLITLLALLPLAVAVAHRPMSWTPPAQAQIIDQRALNAIPLASQDKTDGTYVSHHQAVAEYSTALHSAKQYCRITQGPPIPYLR